jgi:serine/threonine-protein kinase
MQLADGHKLQNGKYRIEKKIGQGGFGITYLARFPQKIKGAMGTVNSFSYVVIKEFFWSRYCNREADGYTVSISSTEGQELMVLFKEKLKKEGKIISKLTHPNIVSVIDTFEENNTAYLVMQYIIGESLDARIRRLGIIDGPAALKYTEQICSALSEIHSKRIMHLDIKPSNVLIDEDDNVQVIDFGISKQYEETETRVTSNTPLGVSNGYSPIEQYGSLKSFSPPTDIYSTGATLYKMLTGRTPLEATARNQFDLEPVTHFNPNISEQIATAINKAMNEKVRDRFQSIQDFLQALKSNNQDNERATGDMPVVNKLSEEKEAVLRDDTKIDALPKNQKQPEKEQPKQTPIKKQPLPSSTLWKKVLLGAGIAIVAFALIFYFYNTGKPDKTIRTTYRKPSTTVAKTVQTDDHPKTSGLPQLTEEKERLEKEAKAKQEQERLRKEKEEKERLDKEAKAKQEQERLRKEKEEKERLDKEAKAKQKQKQEQEQERLRKEKEEKDRTDAENFLKQANSVFGNSSLGAARLDQSFQLYLKAKNLGGDASAGYRNFLSLAQSLIGGGAGYDGNVKKLLEYAPKLNNTKRSKRLTGIIQIMDSTFFSLFSYLSTGLNTFPHLQSIIKYIV